jgi:hypothetical protein
MRIVPIEVKSADHVQSKSLKVFREKYSPPLSIRISAAEFGLESGITLSYSKPCGAGI